MDRPTRTPPQLTEPAETAGPPLRTATATLPRRDETPAPAPAVVADDPSSGDRLHLRAEKVLRDNWTGTSTVPSHGLYPHQWSWDSAFISIGLRHLSPLRAQTELETLFGAQWADGRLPHIVFHPSVPLDAYFPSPDFWRSSVLGRASGAPRTVETSGIVQPPVHALAAWLVHRADPGLSRSRGFLARLYPHLAAWHRYLLCRRDLGGAGLASVVHPWEQGMDNSPCWDGPLSRVTPAPAHSFQRCDLDHGAAADRPTDLDYGRYVSLATRYRDGGYADGEGEGEFTIEDPAFNALLIASEYALVRIARELGFTGTVRLARAQRLTAALVDRLWDPAEDMFLCRDVRTGEPIRERSVSGLIPLLLPDLPREIVAALTDTLRGPHFGLGTTTRLVPSYDLTGGSFDPHRYWRGPAWFNTGWLVERGLRLHGDRERAASLRDALLTAADDSDFAEYVDPFSGEACGAKKFGWTAALSLDLLHRVPAARTAGQATTPTTARAVRRIPRQSTGPAPEPSTGPSTGPAAKPGAFTVDGTE